MTSEQQSQPPPSEDQTGGNGNGSPCGKDVIALELTEKMRNEQLVSNIFSSYRSKSLIVMLNHKYENKPINLPILHCLTKLRIVVTVIVHYVFSLGPQFDII